MLKKIQREHFWLFCLGISPVLVFFAVFNTSLALLALIFIVIGVKGVLWDFF